MKIWALNGKGQAFHPLQIHWTGSLIKQLAVLTAGSLISILVINYNFEEGLSKYVICFLSLGCSLCTFYFLCIIMDLRVVILIGGNHWKDANVLRVEIFKTELEAVNCSLSILCEEHEQRHLLPENFLEKSIDLVDYHDEKTWFYFSITTEKRFV